MSNAASSWAEHWRALVEARRTQVESLNNQGPQNNYWDRRADQFRHMTERFDVTADPLVALLRDELPDHTLLDVGAGAGRFALPLGKIASSVTAVEPSEAMRRHLSQMAAASGLTNIHLVGTTWEEAEVEPHDVVIASHVLYPIADVVPFLRKLDTHARQMCVIVIRVDQIGADLPDLWRRVWGSHREPEPTLLDLYNLLFAIDIRANVQIIPFSYGTFDTQEEAIEQTRGMLFLPSDDHQHDTLVKEFVAARLVQRDGRLTWREGRKAALVWWRR